MKRFFTLILFLFSTMLCSYTGTQQDEKESTAKRYFEERVTSESNGSIGLNSFEKTDGFEKEVQGMKLFIVEWEANVKTSKEIWKNGNDFEGYWNNFKTLNKDPKIPGFAAGAMGTPIHFNQGAVIKLNGKITLHKTEKGWRVEEFSILKSQTISHGDIINNSNSDLKKKGSRGILSGLILGPQSTDSESSKYVGTWVRQTGSKETIMNVSQSKIPGKYKITIHHLDTEYEYSGTIQNERMFCSCRDEKSFSIYSISSESIRGYRGWIYTKKSSN